jgi:hypothetical protein
VQLRKQAETLRDDLNSYLVVVVEAPKFETEKVTLAGLAKFKFGSTKAEYLKAHMPREVVSRDTEAVMQGTYPLL